jgi:hypothetical protein
MIAAALVEVGHGRLTPERLKVRSSCMIHDVSSNVGLCDKGLQVSRENYQVRMWSIPCNWTDLEVILNVWHCPMPPLRLSWSQGTGHSCQRLHPPLACSCTVSGMTRRVCWQGMKGGCDAECLLFSCPTDVTAGYTPSVCWRCFSAARSVPPLSARAVGNSLSWSEGPSVTNCGMAGAQQLGSCPHAPQVYRPSGA